MQHNQWNLEFLIFSIHFSIVIAIEIDFFNPPN